MSLASGQSLAHYEVLGPLGAGAMGEVYRARDTRLDREVALKVLPEALADDEERLRRFEREAKALAALNHPNVAQVFGIDQIGDTCFMVMELVRGEDLAARLARGALQLPEAIDVCRQIAEGVEAAHEAGVIHRDLKPANVVVTPEGQVKVLDFGLAKSIAAGEPMGSRTDSVLSTEEGRLLGTPTYMAPEQARGRTIDRRVDVWAFGCVLYECLTGRRAFDGESLGDVLAAVIECEVDRSALPASTPGHLRMLLDRCLSKDPRRRLRDIGEARVALELPPPNEDVLHAPPASSAAGSLTRYALAVTSVAAVGLGLWAFRMSDEAANRPHYVSVPLTASNAYHLNPSWSPEGEWIAVSRMDQGSSDLFLRHVSSGEEITRRAGPGDESTPCWSPDGEFVAFVATDLPGTPVMIAPPYAQAGERVVTRTNMRVFDSSSYGQAIGDRAWSRDSSSLLVSRALETGQIAIWRIGLRDGTEKQLSFPPAGSDDLSASYSFAWDRIVFVRRGIGTSRMMWMDAEGGEPTLLLEDGGTYQDPAWLPGDQWLVYRGERKGRTNLWRVRRDGLGAEPLTSLVGMWAGGVAVSGTGRIAYTTNWHDTVLTVLDLESRQTTPLTRHAGDNFGPRFSPDGRAIAYHSDRTGDSEVWVHDLDGSEHRITRSAGNDIYPDWSPDGQRLVFLSDRDGRPALHVADRDGGNRRALQDHSPIPTNPGAGGDSMSARWSPASASGELIGYIVANEQGKTLWGVAPDGDEPPRELLVGVTAFDWYLDSRRVICTLDRGRAEELVAVDLESGETRTLWTGPHAELDVAPDGRWVMFCRGLGHLNMGLATLALVPPEEPGGLPSARGGPVDIVRPEGRWHVHHGGWAPDSGRVVYVHDADRGNVHELVEARF